MSVSLETQTETAEPEVLRPYTYPGVIPKLGPKKKGDLHPSLLPTYGGHPGLEYLQCPVLYQRHWQDEGWQSIHGTHVYTIVGPEGTIDCVLLVKGERLKSTDHQSNRRKMFLDSDIARITGLSGTTGVTPLEEAAREAVDAGLEGEALDSKIAELEGKLDAEEQK